MHVLIEPELERWAIRSNDADRSSIIDVANRHAARFGTGRISSANPIIATGHQAWLWHPGILAKYVALHQSSSRFNATELAIVVDHDSYDALALELPINQQGRLVVQRVELAPQSPNWPLASSPPVDTDVLRRSLIGAREKYGATLVVDLEPILAAATDLPDCRTLAEQIAVLLARLISPIIGMQLPILFSSEVSMMAPFQTLVQKMLHDPQRCVEIYNAKVSRHDRAGMTPLCIEADRIELPLWGLTWCQPRRRVFADISGSVPVLVLENGRPLDKENFRIAPRAVLLTGFLRSVCCDFFIHGRGGAIYDRISEQWLAEWRGIQLAPIAVVSADLHLPLDAPVAHASELSRAHWRAHHLPHNIDRVLDLDGLDVRRKHMLLTHMDDDRDRVRRAKAFREIHQINDDLGIKHADVLDRARHDLARTKVGVANRDIARKRDWCFAFYGHEQLNALSRRMENPTK